MVDLIDLISLNICEVYFAISMLLKKTIFQLRRVFYGFSEPFSAIVYSTSVSVIKIYDTFGYFSVNRSSWCTTRFGFGPYDALFIADVEPIAAQHGVHLHAYSSLQPMIQLPLLCACVASRMLMYELELGRLPTPEPITEVFSTTKTEIEVGIGITEKIENRQKITEISVSFRFF